MFTVDHRGSKTSLTCNYNQNYYLCNCTSRAMMASDLDYCSSVHIIFQLSDLNRNYLPVYLYKQNMKANKRIFTLLFKLIWKLILHKTYLKNVIIRKGTSPLINYIDCPRVLNPKAKMWASTKGPTTLTWFVRKVECHHRASNTDVFRTKLSTCIYTKDIIFWTETETS